MRREGKIVFVGISYGPEYITPKAVAAIREADTVVGHPSFVDQVRALIPPGAVCCDASPDLKDFLAFRRERFRLAYEAASRGDTVVCVSSGDPGIFATMFDFYREIERRNVSVAVEVVPGITAAQIAAARIGGPLLTGFCLATLCDDLLPDDETERKIEAAAWGDMAAVLYKLRYNAEFHPDEYPAERYPQFHPAAERSAAKLRWMAATFAKHREPSVPVILVQRLGSERETLVHTDLEHLPSQFDRIDFATLLFVGTSRTRLVGGKWVAL
jgi:precorrin-3B C17-methyltransferase